MESLRRIIGIQKPLVRVLRMAGMIKAGKGQKDRPKAVVLEINSTGGSAVQSNLIYTRIRNLADKNKLPVISFVEDHAVSGGYWLALSGDEIYADQNSSVGHIGALFMLFGLEGTLKKLGMEPRTIQAGEHKFRLDPFKPLKPEDTDWVKRLLGEVHQSFISLVKERRPTLDVKHKTVFEADIFTGRQAAKIGLIDGVSSDLNALVKKRFGDETVIKRIEPKSRFPFGNFGGFGTQLGLPPTDEIIEDIADLGVQSRYKMY
eukprot:gene7694-8531_t